MRRIMANGEAIAKEPIWTPVRSTVKTSESGELTWLQKVQLAYGVRTMANSPQTPSIPLNISTIGTWVVIIAAILGGFWWAFTEGREIGHQEQMIQQLNDRVKQAEADAAEAKKFGIYAAAGQDEQSGHKPQPKEKKK